ncbi:hypothetical protein EVG20_g2262 [Dentipellis fragilis]|uniref:Uncharacterized protein n=1 Tax=Dentipellis fragilis TaxID=205917 RepID=A0A4Y9Z875_9AGAM|nr:hypothetical protein EVG20_g2262 [Dentipellis fragilis]
MAKKAATKSQTKAAKKAKVAAKNERKEKKKTSKSKDEPEDDQNLEEILDKMRREWEESHAVTEELVEGPPSRRANATLTACPNGNHLWTGRVRGSLIVIQFEKTKMKGKGKERA